MSGVIQLVRFYIYFLKVTGSNLTNLKAIVNLISESMKLVEIHIR